MKKTLFLLLFTIGNLQAQIVRITAGTDLQAAIDNATAGTTFLVEGGNYNSLTISKRIGLIGTGYLLGANGTNTQASPNVATIQNLSFNPGSQNSIISGFQLSSIMVSTHNIIIQRNLVGGILSQNADNTLIKQNFIENYLSFSNSTGFIVKNNIIGDNITFSSSSVPLMAGQIINNTLNARYVKCADSTTTTGNFFNFLTNINIIKNNIFIGKVFVGNNCSTPQILSVQNFYSFDNNVAGGVTFANISNKVTTNFANMFVGYPNNPNGLPKDARFQLPTNSPAKGAGENLSDAGAFGGDEPYVLSGIPIGPVVYDLQVPTSTAVGQTIQVQIKAKVQN
ncbi:hypothetical protein [Emticicia sp. SJ17W-69]|uniref:hypothetical protein n=1 Tax=Emticicia sp. SJ17W-69 TaxID=3421657 RepID=UPI003EB97246